MGNAEDPSGSTNTDPVLGKKVRDALADLAPDEDPLRVASKLKKVLSAEVARRAAELHRLRAQSRSRFQAGFLPYLTLKGLEQASAQRVAEFRARRLRAEGAAMRLWDATCGVGADAVAASREGLCLVASDRDPLHVRYTRANLEAQADQGRGHAPARVCVADAMHLPTRSCEALLVDPDRRAHGRRSLDPERWSPPLSQALKLAARADAACIKLAPGVDSAVLFDVLARTRIAVSVEWIAWQGELREACLWCGTLAHESARAAVLLGAGGGHERLTGTPVEVPAWTPDEARAVRYLADPSPALVRSGLLGRAARTNDMRPVAPRCAYLGGGRPSSSGLLPSWQVLGVTALDRKRVRELLGRHDIGPLAVRKRGHPERAEELARRLRGPGTRHGHLAVARFERGHWAFLLSPAAARPE